MSNKEYTAIIESLEFFAEFVTTDQDRNDMAEECGFDNNLWEVVC